MEAEISRLQTLNDKHQQKLLDHRKDQQKILVRFYYDTN